MKRFSAMILLMLLMLQICPVAFAQGVEIYPATISGKIVLNGINYSDKVDSVYVYAVNSDNYSANTYAKSDGSYSITVNAPSDGSKRTFNIYAVVHLNTGAQFGAGDPATIEASAGVNYAHDFTQDMATLNIDASFTNNDWKKLYLLYYSEPSKHLYYEVTVDKKDSHSLDIPADVAFIWNKRYVYPENSDKFGRKELDKKEFMAKQGEVINLTWNGSFSVISKIHGTISFSPLPEGTLLQHRLYTQFSDNYYKNDCDYNINCPETGSNIYMTMFSYFNNSRQTLYWPYSYYSNNNNPYINLSSGEDRVINFTAVPSVIKGKVKITGSASLKDMIPDESSVVAKGKSDTITRGGESHSKIDPNTGEYTNYLTPGVWDTDCYDMFFANYSSDPLNYMFSYFYYRTVSDNAVKVEPGQVIAGQDKEIPTGMVTVKFTSSDGSLISKPEIHGGCSENVNGEVRSIDVNGEGPRQALNETQATIVAPPGTYTIYTQANVNGSDVIFEPKIVVVIKGVHSVLEVNGPSLNVANPVAELYTDNDSITVKGTATDDDAVSSVKINGKDAKITSTNNSKDNNEVQFEEEIPILKGPNRIETIASDSSGKVSSDIRYIYFDSKAPVLSIESPDGTMTDSGSVIIRGQATDDSKIESIVINASNVDFISTGNPADPNEVSFQKTVTLLDGVNKFTVTANDNCKRSTSSSILVNRVNKPQLGQEEIHVDKNELADITTTVYGSTPVSVMNGTGVLIPGTDYNIYENNITIKKSYLNYYFTKFPDQNLYLNINLSNGKNVILTVYTGATAHPEISPVNLSYTGADVNMGCVLSGNYIASIRNDNSPLIQRIDYTYSPATQELIIRKGFIADYFFKNTSDLKLDIKFTGGDVKTVTIRK